MDGIASFHCPLCKCKTTVDFTSHLVEKDATIATLTAERDATIDDLRERMAALEGELLGAQDANKAFRTTIAELREALAWQCLGE